MPPTPKHTGRHSAQIAVELKLNVQSRKHFRFPVTAEKNASYKQISAN